MSDRFDAGEPQFLHPDGIVVSGSNSLPPDWSYETTVAEIETIINQIERGELELAAVFEQFAVAVNRLRQCETFLTRQRQQVDLLTETLLDEPES